MGIPKFFRWISERYPLTSQIIEENKIPEFDNLYVDFNGIIHNCSHPNDDDPHFRLSEEQMFTAIFAYIEHLFGKIKPKKLFFMAVDGVAPRAKMNQQRSRRFRTVKEAKELRERAERNGEKLPDEKAFDSNCITPGTPFMTRLSEQLKYFVNKKISEDSNWREVQVVLSGHEVPGEGEHKVMEYIRLSKAQPDYNPNTRHCLYGLDADLIMLGLLSHDPHFCLLREEVKFGPARKKGAPSLEKQTFFLLHLCLFREYLDLEFHDIAKKLPFDYNLENIIDDFILLAVFVGNDFLPHLPDLHIHENALEKLFEIYKDVLPIAGGYLNESGVINLPRLQRILDALANFEQQAFEKEHADLNWFKGKQKPKQLESLEHLRKSEPFTITHDQQEMFQKVKQFVLLARQKRDSSQELAFINSFPARDRQFLTKLSNDLRLVLTWDEYDASDNNLAVVRLPNGAYEDESQDSDDDGGEEGRAAVDRILSKYEKAAISEDLGDADQKYNAALQQRLDNWKRQYYKEKLDLLFDDKESIQTLAFRYIEGLQWVMHYYYSGVASWGWFYDYHYAPRISDLKDIAKMKFHFNLGKPFRPFEQLMGVLPEASKEHIPAAYRDLMFDPNSPILDFYPQDFVSDLNGKKQDWEAIVKIPFIQEDRLLKAMAAREHRLTKEEQRRNQIGPSSAFIYSPETDFVYPSSLPGFFPDIVHCHCITNPFHLPILDGLHLVKGLCDGVQLGAYALAGFPSLQTLAHDAQVLHHAVNVFQADSRNQSVVLFLKDKWDNRKAAQIAAQLVGSRVYYNWPFLLEGLVVAVSDSHFKYESKTFHSNQQIVQTPHNPAVLNMWARKAERHESFYSKRYAVILGDVEVLIHVRPLKGLKRLDDGSLVKDWEDEEKELDYPAQLTVLQVASEDERFKEQQAAPLSEEFPQGTMVFFLGEHAYGVVGQVQSTEENSLSVTLAFFPSEKSENDHFTRLVLSTPAPDYYPGYSVANMLHMSGLAVSKITSSFMVIPNDGVKTNLGLSLKFGGKGLKVMNYTRKEDRGWEYSAKAVELLRDYKMAFPEIFQRLDIAGDAMMRASDLFSGNDPDSKVKAARNWLNEQGVRDLEAVPLSTEALDKEVVEALEKYADSLKVSKSTTAIKKAKVTGIPRQAVLKPSHAAYRLRDQVFRLGDRVIMVQDSGGVPLCAKGVVIGLNEKFLDVIWDNAFMAGTTLSGRCSEYRGSTCTTESCLNLTLKQFIVSTKPQAATTAPVPVRLRNAPEVQRGGAPFRGQNSAPMRIISNPTRGRGGIGHGNLPSPTAASSPQISEAKGQADGSTSPVNLFHSARGNGSRGRAQGAPFRGRGAYNQGQNGQQEQNNGQSNQARGRGANNNRGRGAYSRGSFSRGRGRGGQPQAQNDGAIVPS